MESNQEPVIIENNWTDKVLAEKDSIQNKIEALSLFTLSPEYAQLDQDGQLLLQAQLSVMVTYSQLLTLRIISNIQGEYLNEDKPNPVE